MKHARQSVVQVLLLALVFAMAGIYAAWAQPPVPPKGVTYSQVAPILQTYCLNCHGSAKAAKGLRLDNYDNVMKGSDHEKVVVPGDPQKSEIMLRVTGAKTPRMPRNGPPWLSAQETAKIEEWIATGAQK